MSDAILCPVCDSYNPDDATHCEVCGERLTPPEPGESIPPEENVAAMLAEEISEVGEIAEPEPEDKFPESIDGDFPTAEGGFGDAGLEEGTADAASHAEELRDASAEVESPAVLYSPVDGTAYVAGSPEYEEGFGPMGEELVAEAPVFDQAPEPSEAHVEPESDYGDGGFEDEYGDDEPVEEAAAEPVAAASAAFQSAFQVREKQRPEMEPLAQPGTLVEPATLTLYVNREPVLTHAIDTDETLVGRRDPVADAYPDVDLTEWDGAAMVSRKHCYVYRQNRNYTLYVVSNAGTQVNSDLLDIGDRRALVDGDVIVIAGKFAIKFDIPNQ